MAERKELDMDNLDEVAGGVRRKSDTETEKTTKSKSKSRQKISGQNNNSGLIQNNVVEKNEGDVKIIGPIKIESGEGTTNLNF